MPHNPSLPSLTANVDLNVVVAALNLGKIFEAVREQPLYVVQEKTDERAAGNSGADGKSQIASL